MKRKLPVIHDDTQYDQIAEYGIRYGAGYALVILKKGSDWFSQVQMIYVDTKVSAKYQLLIPIVLTVVFLSDINPIEKWCAFLGKSLCAKEHS